jgi:hypothetical protein
VDTSAAVPLRCDEALFRSLTVTVVPEAKSLSESEWSVLYDVIDQALCSRPHAVRNQLSAFISLIRIITFARHAKSFSVLSAQQRYGLLHSLETSRITVFRKGMWGLRTVLMMGFYARSNAASAIGYRADRTGWAALRPEIAAQ